MGWFPLVGLGLGLSAAGGALASARLGVPHTVSGLLSVLILAVLTRGLHLDGLADAWDAIGSGKRGEEALSLMKDPRLGAFGGAALFFLLAVKWAALSSLIERGAWQWIALAPALSRASLVLLAALTPYARPGGGLGAPFCRRPAVRSFPLAWGSALAFAWILFGEEGLIGLLVSAVSALPASAFYRRRFGGVTGDLLGAHLEEVEAALLLLGAAL